MVDESNREVGIGSVTDCLNRAKQGEPYAQLQLWERYLSQLLVLSEKRLQGIVCGLMGPEDLASIVFTEFLRGVEAGRFRQLEDRHDLWQLLVMLVKRRSISERRRAQAAKRGNGRLHNVSSRREWDCLPTMELAPDSLPTAEDAALLAEEVELRLSGLRDAKLRDIAVAKMSGFSNAEIAEQLNCSLRSVERKLSIIRRRWSNSGTAEK